MRSSVSNNSNPASRAVPVSARSIPSIFDSPQRTPESVHGRSAFPFKADIDLTELDGRGRPGPGWAGKSCEISRNHIVFRSRRLCYEEREIVVAVHLIDDRPAPLFGRVTKCEYDGDGLYRTVLTLAPVPHEESIKAWLGSLLPRV
jgi:hypothetical protein